MPKDKSHSSSGVFSTIFGSSSSSKKRMNANLTPTPQEAIQKLREMEDLMHKKTSFLEKKIDDEVTLARRYGTKNKRAALLALKRKKRYEVQLSQIDGTLTTIEYQREALESASTNTEVLSIMGVASKALASANKNLDLDQVQDLMDDIAEQQDVAAEVTSAISNPIGFGNDVDEDELLRELESLEQETLDERMLDAGKAPDRSIQLPNVPTSSLSGYYDPQQPQQQQHQRDRLGGRRYVGPEHDDDMKKLAAWAN